MKNRVITISREFGSGGRTIGKRVAEELGIPCYDNELLTKIAQDSGFNRDYIQEAGEYAPGGFLSNTFSHRGSSPNNADYLWQIQYKIISELAEKGPCVVVGRCADYILRDNENCISVFISARMEDRIRRAVEYAHIEEKEAEEYIRKADKSRASYYNYYTDKIWGAAESYDLCISSSVYGIDETTALIREFVSKR